MKLTKHGLLAAVAAAALVAGAGSAVTQTQEKGMSGQGQTPSAQGGSELKGGAKVEKDKKAGAQTQMKDEGAKTQGGAKIEGSTKPGQAQQKPDAQPRGQVQQQPGAKEPGQAQQPGAKQPGQAQQPGAKQDKMQKPDTAQGQSTTTSKSVQINEEQRTKISQTIKTQNVNLRRVSRSDVNFTINVGAVVPRTFNLVVLPAPIIAVVPQFRGYLYIVVDDQLLIIHPQTYEIVAVLPA